MAGVVSKKLRRHAKMQDCTLQIHPYCNMNPETVVFCHFPSEDKGTSIKSPDWWGAYGCSACHDIIDGRFNPRDVTKEDIDFCKMRGMYRTTKLRIADGLISHA